MNADEIQVGKWYRAKDKRRPPRYVLHISQDRNLVQIDGPEVPDGWHYPNKQMSTFLKWCGGLAVVDERGYVVGNGQPKVE